jgi:hypothetical protein
MALADREYGAFPRTARVMHLVVVPSLPNDPVFESSLPVDSQARDDIMAQVVMHGFGKFLVVLEFSPEQAGPTD